MPPSYPSVFLEDEAKLLAQLGAPPLAAVEVIYWVSVQEEISRYVSSGVDPQVREGVLLRWCEILCKLPGPFVVRAFAAWDSPEMPTPHEIEGKARALISQARWRLDLDVPTHGPRKPFKREERPPEEPMSPEKQARYDELRKHFGLGDRE
ncbi:MAG: hypothetical protein AAGD08_22505 [Pseudomonadota bacterium]